jgi:hypothetical protein
MTLVQPEPGIFTDLVSRLVTIALHFGDGTEELDDLMRELAPLLSAGFQRARQLQSVHVGFPSSRPISIPLEDIFHGVAWTKLVCFGIQGWKLHASEIIAITSRHRNTLRGLRLRDVLLKDGSRWKDVLPRLRNDMTRLEWCSLRRIGYASHFDELASTQGAEIPDLFGGTSESSESSEEDSDDMHDEEDTMEDSNTTMSDIDPASHLNGHVSEAPSSSADWSQSNGHESDQDSTAPSTWSEHGDDEHVMAGIQMEFPPHVAPEHDAYARPELPSTSMFCNCGDPLFQLDLEQAGEHSDNGGQITNRTRKLWEDWVIGRCPLHDRTST